MYYGKLLFSYFASLYIFCCISFSPIKQLDVSSPVFQGETVDSPVPSNISGETDGMEVGTEPMTQLTDLQPERQGTAVVGMLSSFFARHIFQGSRPPLVQRGDCHHRSMIVFKTQIANKEIWYKWYGNAFFRAGLRQAAFVFHVHVSSKRMSMIV